MCINCSKMKKICKYAAEPRRRGKGQKPRKTRQKASDPKADERQVTEHLSTSVLITHVL